jgi:hypothetical protein
MDPEDLAAQRQVRRLLLAVATDLDDARQQLLREVGFDIDDWYVIAVLTAQELVRVLDAEYITAQLLGGKDLPADLPARAREATISRIERILAQVLDNG